MRRTCLLLPLLAVVGCKSTTQPPTPSAPSLSGTLTYTAGGSTPITGSQGYWFGGSSGGIPLVHVVAWAAAQAGTDSLHPPLDGLELIFGGTRFANFPAGVTVPVGLSTGASLGIEALSGTSYYAADSGNVVVRPLGGGYVHVDLSIRCPPYRFQGSLEVPGP